jgi:branched-chain amino acid transport system ATP-binding protein
MSGPDPLLDVRAVRAGYGHIIGVDDVSLTVERGELVALLGSNGAGKSTLLRTISGVIVPRAGSVVLDGVDVTGRSSDRLVRDGMAHVPEGRRMLPRLTVEDNLRLGAFGRRDRRSIGADVDAAFERFPALGPRRHQRAGTLSGGEQQMLAIGRALMSRPRLLLLDEPSLGLSPLLVKQVFAMVRQLRDEGITVLLVEQNATQGLAIADRAYVLTRGRVTAAGRPDELRALDVVGMVGAGIEGLGGGGP